MDICILGLPKYFLFRAINLISSPLEAAKPVSSKSSLSVPALKLP